MSVEFPDEYLGDGVYASCDGFHIVLDLRAQGPDRIALDPEVLEALDLYREKIKNMALAASAEGGS